MRKIIKTFLILIFTIVSARLIFNCSYAQDENIKILSLDEFIRLASVNDTRFEEILINQLKLKYKKGLELPPADLVVSLKNEYDFFLDPYEEESENSISLSKLFPFTGTTITAEYDSSLSTSSREVSSARDMA